jgi:hypothetical protein
VPVAENEQTYFATLPQKWRVTVSLYRGKGVLQIVGYPRVYTQFVSTGKKNSG